MPLSNCAVCGKKKSTFIKNQEINIFQMITLKWIKSLILTDLRQIYAKTAIKTPRIYL